MGGDIADAYILTLTPIQVTFVITQQFLKLMTMLQQQYLYFLQKGKPADERKYLENQQEADLI